MRALQRPLDHGHRLDHQYFMGKNNFGSQGKNNFGVFRLKEHDWHAQGVLLKARMCFVGDHCERCVDYANSDGHCCCYRLGSEDEAD
jgi:hypothetical protein